MPLIDSIAKTLYSADTQYSPWESALPEDRDYFTKVADVVADSVVDYIRGLRIPSEAVADYLQVEFDIERLKRS